MRKKKFIIASLVILFFVSWKTIDFSPKPIKNIKRKKHGTIVRKISNNEILYIKLFSQLKIESFTLAPETGKYRIWANGIEVANTETFKIVKLSCVNDSIEIRAFETVIGKYKHVKIASQDSIKTFRLKLMSPDRKPRFYQDNLLITAELGELKCVNEIVLDNYIAGVVQAESGKRSYSEFYKVQAIMARTFALSNLQKHAGEDFNLCDHTHCQVYFGKSTEADILKSVRDTKGKVVVDDDLNLIDATFHSNSGGQTANSEDVWGRKLPYLRSVKDTFSIKMPNAKWERKIAKDEWLTYLKAQHNYPIEDTVARKKALNFKQEVRIPYLEMNTIKVPLKNVRTDFQLKSTFFSIVQDGDSVIFKGRGFGHGVGMCQEGAMHMAKLGYKHTDVINFYYQKIQLIDLYKLSFFRDE